MNKRAFALGAAMVLLGSAVAVALRSFAEAAFLQAYGAKSLPWLLIAQAGGFAAAALGYDALTRRARPAVVDLVLVVMLGVAAAVAPALLAAGAPPVVLVVALAATSQVVALALWNRVAAAVAGRDARRMLPLAGAAVTLGGAIAGLGAGVVIPRLGLAALPYAGAVLTAIAFVVCLAQQRALAAHGSPGAAPAGASTRAELLSPSQSALLRWLIAVAVVEAIVSTVIDLQFAGALKARYTGDELAVAISLFYGGTNAILFVLQSLAVPHLLVTRSLPFSAAIHPIAVMLSYAGFAIAPGFIAIAATRTSDQVLRLATSRTTQELAMSALPPGARARWKVLLRGALAPLGTAAAALVLFAIGPAALRSPGHVAGVAIAIAAAWGIAARVAARRFGAALAAPLGIRATAVADPRAIDLATLERWVRAAGDSDATGAALARAALARAKIDASALSEHLRHDDAAVRAALFEQLARSPDPTLGRELRAAVAIEDDDRALALGIEALAIAGDPAGVTRGAERAGLSRDVDAATRTAERMIRGTELAAELATLVTRDGDWAVALVRAHPTALDDATVATILTAAAHDHAAPALAVIAKLALPTALPTLVTALDHGEPAATSAIAELDAQGAAALAAQVATLPAVARAVIARAAAAAPAAGALVTALAADVDPEVGYAALRSALAIARGGGVLDATAIARAHDRMLAALGVHLDARDAAEHHAAWSACARAELDIATRRCVARLLWTSAVAAAVAGRDPAPLAATARHLIGARDADRKRALDVVQELAAPAPILAAIERWLEPPSAPAWPTEIGDTAAALVAFDPWLAAVVAGELRTVERAISDLRRTSLFGSVAGPALAALAATARRESIAGELFRVGAPGDAMFVVTEGRFVARRAGAPDRAIEPGAIVGEVAVLTQAPRAATVVSATDDAEVLVIERADFTTAARRAPELVLGLSATLAAWLAPDRPDVL